MKTNLSASYTLPSQKHENITGQCEIHQKKYGLHEIIIFIPAMARKYIKQKSEFH